jgi:hypothetical protein
MIHIAFYSFYLHCDKSKLGRAKLSGIASQLVIHFPRLEHPPVHVVPQVEDPVLHSHRAAHCIVVTTEHKDVKVVAAFQQVRVDRHHGVLAVGLRISDGATALTPLDVRLDVNGGLDLCHMP